MQRLLEKNVLKRIIKQVKELCAKSHSYNEIGRILHLDRKTIRKYANMDSELNLESIKRNARSSLDDYHNEILQFLHDHYKTKEIYKLLKDLGYTGKYSTLKWYVTKIKKNSNLQTKLTCNKRVVMNLVYHKLSERDAKITRKDLCKIYELYPHVKVILELFYEFINIFMNTKCEHKLHR